MMATPIAGQQAPGFYRHKVGQFEFTALSDGNLALEAGLFAGDPAGAEKMLHNSFLKKDAIHTAVNAWLINTGSKLILVDAGGGSGFAPTLGKLPHSLAGAGVNPDAVDIIVMTHMHPDHIPGITTADGKPAFKNAVVHVNGDEYAFWTSDEIRGKAPEQFHGFFDMAKAAIKPYADAGKVQMTKDGSQIAPGVTSVFTPGHTVGHSMVRLSSGGDQLLVWGDIVHCAALQFAEPERSIAFDNDPATAISNRKKVMDMVSTDRLLFAGSHLSFPGLGHAVRSGTGYGYVPLQHHEHL
jgi:glyoxylase-like metal-dependent hydrolase (beta-lactamase superfamily II)